VKTLRGVIAGFGKVAAEAHLAGFGAARGFEIVAVVDPSEASRAAAAERLPGARGYANLAAALEAETKLDFADVATPPRYHASTAIAALECGLHVLCEKPLAVDLAEVGELRRAVRRSGRTLFTVHNWKYAPMFRRLHGLLRGGAIGEVREIDWQVLRPNPPQGAADAGWRLDRAEAGGGILLDHGWHAFYLMMFLLGRAPHAVTARLTYDLGFGVENDAECALDFGATTVRIKLRWGADERKTGGVARGSRGEIAIEDDRLVVWRESAERETTHFAPPLSASSYHAEWFPALAADFREEMLHAARRGQNLAEAVCVAETVAAAYRSEGQAISLLPPAEAVADDR
jgi:predicted dehydrogenase